MTTELDVQNTIRLQLQKTLNTKTFKINVGIGWQASPEDTFKLQDGSLLLKNPRPFGTLGSVDETKKLKGFSDLIAITPVLVTPEMVGTTITKISFIEVKNDKGRPSLEQLKFISVMQGIGCRAGIARSPDDAIRIVRGGG